MSIFQNIIGEISKTDKRDEIESRKAKKARHAEHRWYSPMLTTPASAERRYRRAQERDRQNIQDRFYRNKDRQIAEADRDQTRRAVAVLREVERRADAEPGTLFDQLVDEGKLVGVYASPIEVLAAFGIDENATLDLYESLQGGGAGEAARYTRDAVLDEDRWLEHALSEHGDPRVRALVDGTAGTVTR